MELGNISIEKLLELVSGYDIESVSLIEKAYNYAYSIHGEQRRKSGELYIMHPLFVAYFLASIGADCDTICAALLHDVIEDGENITKEDITHEFNDTVAILTDGVTKMKLELFDSKEAQNNANTRKIIMGMKTDVRIIIIKLVDRLHNMLTLDFLPRNKQIQNSLETLEIFVPLANRLGLQQLKNMLEELAFKHLNNDIYNLIDEKKNRYILDKKESLEQTKNEFENILNYNGIDNNISYRFKRNYSIYRGIISDKNPRLLLELGIDDICDKIDISSDNIHDLQSLKVIVNNIEECYSSLELLQHNYEIIPGKVKDCIYTPKTNGYQSIHTTILDNNNEQLQTQIRTNEMDIKDSWGIADNWRTNFDKNSYCMQNELYNKFPFFKKMLEIDKYMKDDASFVEQVKIEILSEMIYPFNREGKVVELPLGSTIIDFASYELENLNNKIIALVNGRIVSPNYMLKSKDNVDLVLISNKQLANISYNVITTRAKQRIRSLHR